MSDPQARKAYLKKRLLSIGLFSSDIIQTPSATIKSSRPRPSLTLCSKI